MTKPHFRAVALLALLSCLAFAQDPPNTTYVLHPNQEVRVPDLPSLKAKSHDPSDVLVASLDTIFHDQSICCGRNSALEDVTASVDPLSLQRIGSQLQGRHLLSDGRPILVKAEFLPASSTNAGYQIVAALMDKRALLMVWNSHLYIVYGAVYDEYLYSDGNRTNAIRKFMLLDPRFSDARREVVFDRETDDWNKVQGTLALSFAPQ
jgi:hypothetical protein